MIDRFVSWVAGNDDVDTFGLILAMAMGAVMGVMLATIKDNNRLMRDVSGHLDEQRRLSLAAARREFAAKEKTDNA